MGFDRFWKQRQKAESILVRRHYAEYREHYLHFKKTFGVIGSKPQSRALTVIRNKYYSEWRELYEQIKLEYIK